MADDGEDFREDAWDVSADTEAAWQAFTCRGPWVGKSFHPLDYPPLYDFIGTVHMRGESLNSRQVARRLITDGLVPDPDPDVDDDGPWVAGLNRADHIAELFQHGMDLLVSYDALRSFGDESGD